MIETKRTADLVGPAARAWSVPMDASKWSACIAAYVFHAPCQSPAWSGYYASVIHMRDVPGAEPAHVSIPGATHEIVVLALDEKPTNPDEPETFRYLQPANYGRQFSVPTDADACSVLDALARAFCAGRWPFFLEPPYSGDSLERRTVHDSIDETARCIREGGHRAS